MENKLRQLPGVDKLLGEEKIKELEHVFPHILIVDLIREHLEGYRQAILQGGSPPGLQEVVENIYNKAQSLTRPSLRALINATGVVLHTNLGRAPLSEEAIAAMDVISRDYNNLEFDLDSGDRGSRHTHLESLLCRLAGAESALVVNNNASAVLLVLTVLAKRKEVIVSRGQAVEIGGGFRIPEVMRQSGAKLVEVGTTNCTYIRDYEQAISPSTVAILRVHSSNFKLVGFTHMATLEEMAALSHSHNLLLLDDLGSGCLVDTTQFGLDPEPTVQESMAKGASLAFFSGDKLLGGPQAGIIVGKKDYIDKLKKHPLVRALRVDKTRIAGLTATLGHYLKGEEFSRIPVWQMISQPLSEIDHRASQWAKEIGSPARVIDGESVIGGGSLPGGTLPSRLVAIGSQKAKKTGFAQSLSYSLRHQNPPVIGRISEDLLLLDPRTVPPRDDPELVRIVKLVMAELNLS